MCLLDLFHSIVSGFGCPSPPRAPSFFYELSDNKQKYVAFGQVILFTLCEKMISITIRIPVEHPSVPSGFFSFFFTVVEQFSHSSSDAPAEPKASRLERTVS